MNISKLCRGDTEKLCLYCLFSSSELDNNNILCKKYGAVSKSHCCKKYIYSPLKRIPPKRVQMRRNYKPGDFDI